MAVSEPVTSAAHEGAASAPLAPGFEGRFRRYQTLALEAFEAARERGRDRCYVVMPPGSGKTLVGLEIARRLGRQAVVFGPNTAIQAQWVREWSRFAPPTPAGTSIRLARDLTALTYQSLCNMERPDLDELTDDEAVLALGEPEEDEEPDGPLSEVPRPAGLSLRQSRAQAAARRRRRKLIVRGGDRAALLGLLHPNGRKLIERMKAAGRLTVILDECHHLLETWGYLVQAVVDELDDDVFVVGLTATPPGDMGKREARLYNDLFGGADFEVPTPAVVKEGELAPYQELAYLTEPLPHERDYMAAQSQRFDDLIDDLMDPSFASRPFLDWIHARFVERGSRSGAQVGWQRLELDDPDLATAALRLFLARGFDLPPGAHVGERHRQPLTADDWAVLIDDYCASFLGRSPDPADERAWERIRRALPSVGYVLTRGGIRSYVSPSDRVLALSASKGAATQTILDLERQQLGRDLRALVLCDYERAGVELLAELRSVLDPQAGSAALIMQLLVSDAATKALDPILLTGRTVACSRSTASRLVKWCVAQEPAIAAALASMPLRPAAESVCVIAPEHSWWRPRNYVPLVTRYFEEGHSRCLVGTRGLLGEGWDARTVNVLVDLTAAATATSVHQMRGRSLRLDPRLPHKVADNWDVVCVAPDDPEGMSDYSRFVRKHRAYYALTAGGEIECGVSHVDPALSPFGPPAPAEIVELNRRALDRIARREEAHGLWAIGKPYRNVEIATVRVHANRSLGLPGRVIARSSGLSGTSGVVTTAGAIFGGYLMLVAAATAPVVLLVGAAAAGIGGAALVARRARRLRSVRQSDSLESIAAAIAEALAATGAIDRSLGPAALCVVVQPDGYYRCYLEGASRADSEAFAEALDQALAPLEDPRYIISRRVVDPPRSRAAGLWVAARSALGSPGGRLIWHAVPDYLAANRRRVEVFEDAWHRHVGGGRALFYRDHMAAGIIAVTQGENPFETTTQMRTLWS
jgi:superfamily II DNA or RNA helicase